MIFYILRNYYILQNYLHAEVEYTFFDRNDTIYPKGFAELLREQMDNMKDVVKLSCDKGKTLGNKAKCDYLLSQIG